MASQPPPGQTPPSETPAGDWADAILDYWLKELGSEGWWVKSAATDATITRRFGALWEEKQADPPASFLGRADTALAAILLFDQFPRNMFRGDAKAFSTDALAREIARGAIARGYDVQTGGPVRAFFYIPFMHSEDLADQEHCLKLIDQPGLEENLAFARKHHAVVARFGRFPHRNAVLGRENRPGEEEAIAEGAGW